MGRSWLWKPGTLYQNWIIATEALAWELLTSWQRGCCPQTWGWHLDHICHLPLWKTIPEMTKSNLCSHSLAHRILGGLWEAHISQQMQHQSKLQPWVSCQPKWWSSDIVNWIYNSSFLPREPHLMGDPSDWTDGIYHLDEKWDVHTHIDTTWRCLPGSWRPMSHRLKCL